MEKSNLKIIGASIMTITLGALLYKYVPEIFYNKEFKKSYKTAFKKVSESTLDDLCKKDPKDIMNKMFLIINRIRRLKS